MARDESNAGGRVCSGPPGLKRDCDFACSFGECKNMLGQLDAKEEQKVEQEEVSQEEVTTQETWQSPDQFCRDRREEGFHCDGKRRIQCRREGLQWTAGLKRDCDFACRFGECKNMLGQLDAKEEQKVEQEEVSQEEVTTQETWQSPDQFCRDRREEGFHCDGKRRIQCRREGLQWTAGLKRDCDFACRFGECKNMLGQLDAKEEQKVEQEEVSQEEVTTQETWQSPDQFCRDRREEGFHCDGKRRIQCRREGLQWTARLKRDCDVACRFGECKNMLGQLDAKEEQKVEQEEVSQEEVTTQETWQSPDQFCRDRREEGFHCDGKRRIQCRREGLQWTARLKRDCDVACRFGECKNMLGQLDAKEEQKVEQEEVSQEEVTTQETWQSPDQFCRDRREEGFHCDGKRRIQCRREGLQWTAGLKRDCDFACRFGECKNMLGQLDAKEEQKVEQEEVSQEAVTTQETWQSPDQFCRDRREEGFHCDGKRRIQCRREGLQWTAGLKRDCDFACRFGECKNMLGQLDAKEEQTVEQEEMSQEAVTTQETWQSSDQFCRDRREEGFHCDGKRRIQCRREGLQWTAGLKRDCDFACRFGECKNMLGQLDAKEEQKVEQEEVSQEEVTTQETWQSPDQFCRDRREEGFHCDGKRRIQCRREGLQWTAGRKRDCDFACRFGECKDF
ncbi:unnamed protein product [Polarella glacialis]|uniref:Uncharacterized protein n=1 Tax=Polarella glacialis TaxID=89957 RepID=A0A813E673_POLGL|nr:unnamed protein product [Polarella glacialis]